MCDVLIIARGGGSIEDLWAFNDENLARCIFNSKIPIVSAVGHETDFTICDFVADLRAPTPSVAAELVVPDMQKLISEIDYWYSYINSLMLCRINDYQKMLKDLTEQGVLANPDKIFNEKKLVVEMTVKKLQIKFSELVSKNKEKFLLLVGKLDALSPLKLIKSGYSVAMNEKNQVVRCINQVTKNDRVRIRLADGELDCEVKNVVFLEDFYGKK